MQLASAAAKLVPVLSLLWAGMTMGIVHDAAMKFSTPGVPKLMLLRVGMHLFRSFRVVETCFAVALSFLQWCHMAGGTNGNGCQPNPQVNKSLSAAIGLSLVRSYVFPIPQLLQEGDCIIAGGGMCHDPSLIAPRFTHLLVVTTEVLKIVFLVGSAAVLQRQKCS